MTELPPPSAITPDGARLLVYDKFNDLGFLNLAKPDRFEPLLHSGFDERLGQMSPDGRWIVYESNESGNQFKIVLRSFPDVSRRREILSINGWRFPRGNPKGSRSSTILSADGAIVAVPITLSPALRIVELLEPFGFPSRESPAADRQDLGVCDSTMGNDQQDDFELISRFVGFVHESTIGRHLSETFVKAAMRRRGSSSISARSAPTRRVARARRRGRPLLAAGRAAPGGDRLAVRPQEPPEETEVPAMGRGDIAVRGGERAAGVSARILELPGPVKRHHPPQPQGLGV